MSLGIRWIHPNLDGRVTSFANLPIVIGRSPECAAALDSHEVSRRHADVRAEGPLFVVRDLGSKNGIFLNAKRVTEAPLKTGDVLRLGDWVGVVIEEDEHEADPFPVYQAIAPGVFGGPVLARALRSIPEAATTDLPIIIEGETGTGKEGAARAVHTWSGRKGPYIAVNCTALPEALAEGELFGYRRGAFTGADRGSPGHFRAAEGGTLLLDEVTDLPLALQPKLLRVLEQREVVPLGESSPVPIDVRILAATQGPLSLAVSRGQFRADLHARLDGITVRLPPLRERVQEIPFLWNRILAQHGGQCIPRATATLIELLCLYPWPYNVRELNLVCRRVLALHGSESVLDSEHLPERLLALRDIDEGRIHDIIEADARSERAQVDAVALVEALRATGGNVRLTAERLGIPRQRVYRMMEQHHDIDLAAIRQELPVGAGGSGG